MEIKHIKWDEICCKFIISDTSQRKKTLIKALERFFDIKKRKMQRKAIFLWQLRNHILPASRFTLPLCESMSILWASCLFTLIHWSINVKKKKIKSKNIFDQKSIFKSNWNWRRWRNWLFLIAEYLWGIKGSQEHRFCLWSVLILVYKLWQI